MTVTYLYYVNESGVKVSEIEAIRYRDGQSFKEGKK